MSAKLLCLQCSVLDKWALAVPQDLSSVKTHQATL